MARYTALIDGEPGAYGVVFPDAPGCHAMGDTIEEALSHAREALAEWLEDAREQGFPIPEPRTAEELLKDPEVLEDIAETGAVMREVY
ncbi:HicB family protein [Methylovirgula ligni]|uniref:Putative RNase H-like HicB family nuclease n=1 Tax=Methylovirgula ligni TaxID=569860 RepID=A0A3D9Z5S8_9HYPH|nr:type II toxin-antitoxin system HicB family antitoxin [Methylovirgula ligni]QAY95092.1 HicB family protein [Methylovirgula ligni]REF89628.1 putative RNase H-like HicB family nuclease [Methylovirgula ligni]